MVGESDTAISGKLPLVVVDGDGTFLELATTNEKAFRKSFEHGALWCVHPETDRVLPFDSAAYGREPLFSTIERRGGYVLAVLSSHPKSGKGSRPADAPPAGPTDTARPDDSSSGSHGEGVVAHLVEVIRDRHRLMPEGSYTSYLFNEGGSKIRKKTGEEAVEVVLSADNEELVRESADLIYHLLVLLEHDGVSWSSVEQELERRSR